MENDKKVWNYSYKFIMPQPIGETNAIDWIDKLDSTQLEMLYLDVFGAELTVEECSEAQQMLGDIGIKC